MVLPEMKEPSGVEESAGTGGVLERGSTVQQSPGEEEEEVGVGVEEEEEDGQGMVHLFRVKTYPAPVWCEVCERLLLGVSDESVDCGSGGRGGGAGV